MDVVNITAVDAVVLAGSDGNLTCTLSDAEASVANPTVTWIDTSDDSEVNSANVETDGLESIFIFVSGRWINTLIEIRDAFVSVFSDASQMSVKMLLVAKLFIAMKPFLSELNLTFLQKIRLLNRCFVI